MKNLVDRSESVLARYWPYLGIGTLLLIALGCAYTGVSPDGQLFQTGQDIIPGVLPEDGLVRDVLGAANDAVQDVDIGQVVKDVAERDWLGLLVTAGSVIAAMVGGIAVRQRIRNKNAVLVAAAVKAETVAASIEGGTGGPGGVGGIGGVGGVGGVGGSGGPVKTGV